MTIDELVQFIEGESGTVIKISDDPADPPNPNHLYIEAHLPEFLPTAVEFLIFAKEIARWEIQPHDENYVRLLIWLKKRLLNKAIQLRR